MSSFLPDFFWDGPLYTYIALYGSIYHTFIYNDESLYLQFPPLQLHVSCICSTLAWPDGLFQKTRNMAAVWSQSQGRDVTLLWVRMSTLQCKYYGPIEETLNAPF